ncbi:hypothetical protein AVEN_137742-1 [Araneus ventricosus]|uniref:Uncharacterized protein n=1 Tax=Araneus ventricosus TaxID=182803 RepID=A0A4Y2NY89_ARAVE|nr:hypothetical protein AVEN_137742-1 [Araneus ventricosus]
MVQYAYMRRKNKLSHLSADNFRFRVTRKAGSPNAAGLSASFLAATAGAQILWELDSLGVNDRGDLSRSDESLIDLFEKDLKFENGRYETKLLCSEELERNYSQAKKRFDELGKGFSKINGLRVNIRK